MKSSRLLLYSLLVLLLFGGFLAFSRSASESLPERRARLESASEVPPPTDGPGSVRQVNRPPLVFVDAEAGETVAVEVTYFAADGELLRSTRALEHHLGSAPAYICLVDEPRWNPRSFIWPTESHAGPVVLASRTKVDVHVRSAAGEPADGVEVVLWPERFAEGAQVYPQWQRAVERSRVQIIGTARGERLATLFSGETPADTMLRQGRFESSGLVSPSFKSVLEDPFAQNVLRPSDDWNKVTDSTGTVSWSGLEAGGRYGVALSSDVPAKFSGTFPRSQVVSPRSDEDGGSLRFDLTEDVSSGQVQVDLMPTAQILGSLPPDLEGRHVVADIALFRGVDHTPPEGAWSWYSTDTRRLETHGEFAFTNLVPGRYKVSIVARKAPGTSAAYGPEYLLKSPVVDLAPFEVRDLGGLAFGESEPVELLLTFTDGDGRALRGEDVYPESTAAGLPVSLASYGGFSTSNDIVGYDVDLLPGVNSRAYGLPGQVIVTSFLAHRAPPESGSGAFVFETTRSIVDLRERSMIHLDVEYRSTSTLVARIGGSGPGDVVSACVVAIEQATGQMERLELDSGPDAVPGELTLRAELPRGRWDVMAHVGVRTDDEMRQLVARADVGLDGINGEDIAMQLQPGASVRHQVPPEKRAELQDGKATAMLERTSGGIKSGYEVTDSTADENGVVTFDGLLPGVQYVVRPGGGKLVAR